MNENKKKLVGYRISRIRDKHNKTLEEFGRIIDNATKSNVSKWEKGEVLPNRKRLKAIAEFDGIHVNELLYGDLDVFARTIFLEEVEKFYNKYKGKENGLNLIKLFELEEANKEFEKWLDNNINALSYDDEKVIREKVNEIIQINIEENKEKGPETEITSLLKAIDSVYSARYDLKNDFYYGKENNNGEIELVLRNGMTKEVYESAYSILDNTAVQLLTLKVMLEQNI